MDGLTVSLITTIITVIISFFVAVLVKVMVMILEKYSKPEEEIVNSDVQVVESTDEADIAAVLAIATSQK